MIKIGGGILSIPGALDAACSAAAEAGRRYPVVIVPGGGPFADAVREFDQSHGLQPATAHSMAILGMEQYAHALAERIAGAVLVESAAEVEAALQAGRIPVLAPSRWMREVNTLPRDWSATSDSVAAFIAGELGARQLVLVKPVSGPVDRLVDERFRSVLPAGVPVAVVGADRAAELTAVLRDAAER